MGGYPGDPDGRRRARQQAIRLAEVGRLVNVLEVWTKHAGLSTDAIRELSRTITSEEQRSLLRAEGRIESRKRFKINSPPPAHDDRAVDYLFLDESGKSQLGSPEPVFALAAISMSEDEVRAYHSQMNDLKHAFFGTTDFTLHEPNIRRHEEKYSFGGDARRRAEFCQALDAVVSRLSFRAFGVAIRKQQFREFVATASDPYLPLDLYSVAIHLLLERYVDYLAMHPSNHLVGRLTFESQGPKENAEHQRDYVELLLEGTQWVPDSAFRHWLETGVLFTRKRGTEPMELADMLSRDIYEWATHDCAKDPRRWPCFDSKIYRRSDMAMGKFGVKVYPTPIFEQPSNPIATAVQGPTKSAPSHGEGRR